MHSLIKPVLENPVVQSVRCSRYPKIGKTILDLILLQRDLEADELAIAAKLMLQKHSECVGHALLFNSSGTVQALRVSDDGFAGALIETFEVNVLKLLSLRTASWKLYQEALLDVLCIHLLQRL